MKKTFILLIVLLSSKLGTFSQSVSINNDGSTPNSNAILDIKSPDKGLLVTRIKVCLLQKK